MSPPQEGSNDARRLEAELTVYLGPYEPLITSMQSLLVWEYPWKSAILFTVAHILFWFFYTTSARFFFLLSMLIMVIVFVDTWKNKIWPEIRVPPKEPEDKDGWTPVHPHLLSVPEISCQLSQMYAWMLRTLQYLRNYRISHPLVFCFGNTALFTITAIIGLHISGFALAYLTMMCLMLWPCIIYHSLFKVAYRRVEPSFEWLDQHVWNKFHVVVSKGHYFKSKLSAIFSSGQDGQVAQDEDFLLQTNELSAALAKAIMSDSEDDTGNSTIPTPGLSESPSFNNSEEDPQELNFDLEMNRMPSFDDLDNTDDELELPESGDGANGSSHGANLSRFNSLQFTPTHFGDSESEDETALAMNLDFSDANVNNNAAATNVPSTSSPTGMQNLAGAFVARTISSMMETALHGVSTLTQGQMATSSSVLPRTGAKITYTCTEEGESIDFQNPQPTILESEEESDVDIQNEHIAEIEKDFDFLHDLDSDSG